jgi:hypothetical protein
MTEPGRDTLQSHLDTYRQTLDGEIRKSGSLERVRRNVLMRRSGNFLAGIPWQRVAAAILVAGMLGGAVDLALPQQSVDSIDVAVVDPLYAIDGAGAQ